jgi:multicomponent Na+:H+ antiporter subunit D
MTVLVPLSVAIPLIVAAALVAAAPVIARPMTDAVAVATSAAVTGMLATLLGASTYGAIIYWYGGWVPVHGFAIGVSFMVDPLGAGIAVLSAGLVLAAFVFSWRYFEAVGTLYHAMMLIFMAAMAGFSLSGDIFNLFVFFELMSGVAYALTGYKVEEESALEGAINFGITNSIGAFLVLIGIGLLYGRTGALNMAQIGRALAGHRADGLVIVALTFIATGFLVKAAMVPFHLWLSDAHAVAPTPVCVIFSGVMVELGLYAVARVYWTMFSGVPGLGNALSPVLLGFGIATAVVGGVMCLLQRHLKRLLAFSTVSHVGIFIIGVALLSPLSLAGSAMDILGHGLVKSALFICSGVILNQAGSVDELELMGQRVGSPVLIFIYMAAALGLAGLPPFANAGGKAVLEASIHGWMEILVSAVMVFSDAITGGAVMRAGGRIFFGWGARPGEESAAPTERRSEPETREGRRRIPSVMLAPAAALVALALFFGLTPRLLNDTCSAAAQFEQRTVYAAAVLDGQIPPALRPAHLPELSWTSGFISTGIAIALALFELLGGNLPEMLQRIVNPIVEQLHNIHSGQVGDYVTWLVVGVSIFGAMLVLNVHHL